MDVIPPMLRWPSTMNKNCKFYALSTEDRQQILRWCDQHSYERAVELAAKPRPEGLGLQTSISAVQRFYATYTPLAYTTDVVNQLAQVLQGRAQIHGDSFRNAILHTVETFIIQGLMAGKELTELNSHFRVMFNLHRLRLQDWKNQFQLDPAGLRDKPRPKHPAHQSEAADFQWIGPDPVPPAQTPPPSKPVGRPSAPPPPAPAEPPPANSSASSIKGHSPEVQITVPDILTSLTGEPGFKSRFAGPPPAASRDFPSKNGRNPGNPAFPTTQKSPAVHLKK